MAWIPTVDERGAGRAAHARQAVLGVVGQGVGRLRRTYIETWEVPENFPGLVDPWSQPAAAITAH
jgi:hypothetical protein